MTSPRRHRGSREENPFEFAGDAANSKAFSPFGVRVYDPIPPSTGLDHRNPSLRSLVLCGESERRRNT